MNRVLLLFIDGYGLGRPDPERNPFAGLPILGNFLPDGWTPDPEGGRPASLPQVVRPAPLPHGGVARSTDASLGVRGLPQSATGQTTLFTGVNGAAALGHHLYGYPGPVLRRILMEHSVLKRARSAGLSAAFLNAYRPVFFELGEAIWEKPMSASSWNNRAAGLPFRDFDDIRNGCAVYHDFTNQEAIRRGFDLPGWSPEEAGGVLARTAATHDLAIYEFFLTDRVGHTGDRALAREVAEKLERFIAELLSRVDLREQRVVVTSDHGNAEEMSVRTHTHNPVPTLVWGPGAEALSARLERLEDFSAALLTAAGGSRDDA